MILCKNILNCKSTYIVKLIMSLFCLIVLNTQSVFGQPNGKYIYSGSYKWIYDDKEETSKVTTYETLYITPYQSPYGTWLKVIGVSKSGKRYYIPSSSDRFVFTKYRSGLSAYAWKEQCIIVEEKQTVIQLYRDITTGEYDEFIYFWN